MFKKALEIEPGNALYELGLACLYEDGQLATESSSWREEAIAHYMTAYQAAIRQDRKLTALPLHGLGTLLSYEAGKSYIRLVRQRGLKETEASTVESIERDLVALQHLRPYAITPIVLSLSSKARLADLLGGVRVQFDLDGSGRHQSYSWIKPDAAFLV